jgi:pyruvate dehydrogenase complex dehydrogenase (E1) component
MAEHIDTLAGEYIKLREAIKDKEEQQKLELAPLKEEFDDISNQILSICNEQNLDSVRTPMGTISRRIWSRFWTSDWEEMHKFIIAHNAPFLLEKRVHNGNMQQFLDENPDEQPIGLQVDRKYVIQVRKPTST